MDFTPLINHDDRLIITKARHIACDKYGKRFRHWKETKTSKELIETVSLAAGIPAPSIIEEVNGGNNNPYKGTYVHPRLAPHIASWISPKVGIIVSDIVNNH